MVPIRRCLQLRVTFSERRWTSTERLTDCPGHPLLSSLVAALVAALVAPEFATELGLGGLDDLVDPAVD